MTKESATAFLTKLENDFELAKKISAAKDNDLRLTIAQEAGYRFTLEELEAARDELDDAALDEVAGGLAEGASMEAGGDKEASTPLRPGTLDKMWLTSTLGSNVRLLPGPPD